MECKEGDNNTRFFAGTALIVLIAGLLIRFILAPTLTYPFDIEHWAVIIQNIDSGYNLYGLSGYFYTPVWGYVLGFETLLINGIGNLPVMGDRFTDIFNIEALEIRYFTATTTTPEFNVVMKIPFIIVDFLVGYLLWNFIIEETGSKKKADLAFALWFLCPVVVYMSSIQAQFDCMSAMFALLTILLLRKDHYFLAGAMYVVASLIKFFPAFMIFVLVIYVFKKNPEIKQGIQKLLLAAAGAITAIVILYAPNIIDGTFIDSLSFIFGRTSEYVAYEKIYTYSMIAVTFIVMIYTARGMLKTDSEDLDKRFLLLATITLAAASLISGGPQYCIVYLPLLAYYAAISENNTYRNLFVVIGLLSMIVAFMNNNVSLLTSVAEYWGWIEPQTVVHVMRDWELAGLHYMTGFVQALQVICLCFALIFLTMDSLRPDHDYSIKPYLCRIRKIIGGEFHD